MKYLANMISGKNMVTELTSRISETKTNPKFTKNCSTSLFFYQIPRILYAVSINLFSRQNTSTDAIISQGRKIVGLPGT